MTIALLLAAAAVLWRLGYPVFETVLALILITPIAAFGVSPWLGLDQFVYLSVFGLLTFFAVIIKLGAGGSRPGKILEELLPLAVLIAAYLVFHAYTLSWPDFIAIGERLRDYGLLSSVIQSPIDLREPWAAGFTLNYYAYWYRFGHMLSSLFGLATWDIYHALQSFTFALYFTCAFRLFNKYLGFTVLIAALFATFIAIGSNFSGVKYFLAGDDNWWGPSRVIKGAINEFPAWSFLLGDLHPHYLNLPLVPFFVLLALAVRESLRKPSQVLMAVMAGYITGALWIYNANAWEVPVWRALLAGIICTVAAKIYLDRSEKRRAEFFAETESFDWRSSLIFAMLVFITHSLYVAQKNIVAPDYPIDWVTSEVGRTSVNEMAQHFGIPLALIAVSFLFVFQGAALRILSILGVLTLLLFNDVIGFLICLFAASFYKLWLEGKKPEARWSTLIIEGCGAVAIGLVIVPEVKYFNDPYGADIDRMNTIFKIYSASWFWLQLYAFYLIGSLYPAIKLDRAFLRTLHGSRAAFRFAAIYVAPVALSALLLTGFFRSTAARLRPLKNTVVEPAERGLSEIDKIFPGAAETIKALSKYPRGVTLEAQGDPYSYTTHVATLAEKPSYLGWANHVNLLSRNDGRVGHRATTSDQIYKEPDCAAKLALLKTEHIAYVVLGPLERQRHPEASGEQFNCMRRLFQHGLYELFVVE